MAKVKKKFIIFHDGRKKEVTGETGKYWICDSVQYRKSNSDIADVVVERITVPKEPKEPEQAEETEEQKEAKEEFEPIIEFEEGFDKMPDLSDIID